MTRLPLIALLLATTAALASCGNRDEILPGERLDTRAVLSPDGPPIEGLAVGAVTPLSLPAPRANAEWNHRAGNSAHNPGHVAIGAGTTRIWSNAIGQGPTAAIALLLLRSWAVD